MYLVHYTGVLCVCIQAYAVNSCFFLKLSANLSRHSFLVCLLTKLSQIFCFAGKASPLFSDIISPAELCIYNKRIR